MREHSKTLVVLRGTPCASVRCARVRSTRSPIQNYEAQRHARISDVSDVAARRSIARARDRRCADVFYSRFRDSTGDEATSSFGEFRSGDPDTVCFLSRGTLPVSVIDNGKATSASSRATTSRATSRGPSAKRGEPGLSWTSGRAALPLAELRCTRWILSNKRVGKTGGVFFF